MQSIQRLGLQPPPAVAVLPLGTGNNLSRYFGWGKKFDTRWLSDPDRIFQRLRAVAQAAPVPLDMWMVTMRAPSGDFFTRKLPPAFYAEDDGQVRFFRRSSSKHVQTGRRCCCCCKVGNRFSNIRPWMSRPPSPKASVFVS